jgi:hypothetical protein
VKRVVFGENWPAFTEGVLLLVLIVVALCVIGGMEH